MDDSNRNTSAVPPLSIAAISALQQGDKLEAIKIVREQRNTGLKAAKDAVEGYVRSQPALQSAFTAAQGVTKRAALRWLAMLIGVAILAYYLLARPRAMAMRSGFGCCARIRNGVAFFRHRGGRQHGKPSNLGMRCAIQWIFRQREIGPRLRTQTEATASLQCRSGDINE